MPVSCCMTLQHRRLLLADLLATHLNDDSKWVRMSAFQILGPFISTFAKQFTEVTYNQHGELVFTSQQDTRFRYKKLQVFIILCFIYSALVLFYFRFNYSALFLFSILSSDSFFIPSFRKQKKKYISYRSLFHCSIRYLYEGIFPTKCAIRSHTLDAEDNNSKDNFNLSVIIQKPIFEEDDDEDESQEDHISRMRAYKSKVRRVRK